MTDVSEANNTVVRQTFFPVEGSSFLLPLLKGDDIFITENLGTIINFLFGLIFIQFK